MSTSKPKRAPLTVGFSVLMLQTLTAPCVIVGALRTPPAQPQWLTGLFLALGLGSLASLGIIALGTRTRQAAARFAPVVLVAPVWIAVAAVSPLVQDGVNTLAYALFALCAAIVSVAPFLHPAAMQLFDGEAVAKRGMVGHTAG